MKQIHNETLDYYGISHKSISFSFIFLCVFYYSYMQAFNFNYKTSRGDMIAQSWKYAETIKMSIPAKDSHASLCVRSNVSYA